MKSKKLEEKDKIVEKEDPEYLEKSLVETSKAKIFRLLFLIFMIFEEIIFQFPWYDKGSKRFRLQCLVYCDMA
jgi:hypothetical protein